MKKMNLKQLFMTVMNARGDRLNAIAEVVDPADSPVLILEEDCPDILAEETAVAVELMRFLTCSRRQGLVSDELVRYAESRLNLACPGSGMTVDRILASEAEGYVYEADPEVARLSIDQLNMYVRQVVDGNRSCLQETFR